MVRMVNTNSANGEELNEIKYSNDTNSSFLLVFNRSFNLSSEIIYDSREDIINKNPHFKIGKTAGGFFDNG